MSTVAAVAKKNVRKTAKIEVMAEPEWVASVQAHADALGLSLSAYIRLAVNEKMARDSRSETRGDQ